MILKVGDREWDWGVLLTIAGIFIVALVIARRWVR